MQNILFRFVPLALVLLVGVATAAPVEARTVVRSGDTVSLAEKQSIEGDFYAAAGKVNISGEVEEDLIAAAGQMSVNGTVGDNALLVAGQLDIFGTVGDDLRIITGEVEIGEPVMGDLFVIGGTVDILSSASVGGDVLVYAGEVNIGGSVGGDVLGRVDQLRIDAPVAGAVDVDVNQLTLGDNAVIDGSVVYTSNEELVQALNSSVGGDLVRNDPVIPGSETTVRAVLVPLLMLLFSALVWFFVSRRSLNLVVARAFKKSPWPLTIGVLVVLFAPVAISLLLASMIGVLIGMAALFAYFLVLILALIAMVAVIGQALMRLFNRPGAGLSLLTLAIGVLGFTLLVLLPYLGLIVLILVFLLTVGALVDAVYRPRSGK